MGTRIEIDSTLAGAPDSNASMGRAVLHLQQATKTKARL